MATKEQLKGYFSTGKIPTAANFAELIDSSFNDTSLPDTIQFIFKSGSSNKLIIVTMFFAMVDNDFLPTSFIERVFNNGAANQFDSINIFVNKYNNNPFNVKMVKNTLMQNLSDLANICKFGFIEDSSDSAIATSYTTIRNQAFKQVA